LYSTDYSTKSESEAEATAAKISPIGAFPPNLATLIIGLASN